MSGEIIERFPHTWTAGDTLPEIVLTLDEFDLTGYTVQLELRRPDESLLVKTASIFDPLQGKFKFEFVATDLQAGIGQLAQIKFSIAAEVERIEQLFLDVRGTV